MTEISKIIAFPKLIDSEIETGITTLNNNHINEKEKIIKLTLKINEWDYNYDKFESKDLKFHCDFDTASNLNYKLKSSLNQIEEMIKYISNK